MLDPAFPIERKNTPQFDLPFVEQAFSKLHRLVKLQLISCPASPFHRKESSVLSATKPASFRQHKRIWELLSANVSLLSSEEIRNAQLMRTAALWIQNERAHASPLDMSDAVLGDLNHWPDRKFSIHLDWLSSVEESVANRDQSNRYKAGIAKLYDRWRKDPQAFAESFRDEKNALADALQIKLIKWYFFGLLSNRDDQSAMEELFHLSDDPEIRLFNSLWKNFIEECGCEKACGEAKVFQFLRSDTAHACPYIRLSAALYAEIKQRVIQGSHRNDMPLNDVSSIAAYLPYCDAIFVDSQMHHLLRSKNVSEQNEWQTHIFSAFNKGEFLSYLDLLQKNASPLHVEIVKRLYGEKWLEPYFRVLKDDALRSP